MLSFLPAVTYKLYDIQTQNKGAVYLKPLKSQAHRERLHFPRRLGKNMRFINVLSGSTLIPTIPGGNSIEKNPTNPVNPVTFYKMVHFQKKNDWNNNIGKSSSYWSCFHCFPKKMDNFLSSVCFLWWCSKHPWSFTHWVDSQMFLMTNSLFSSVYIKNIEKKHDFFLSTMHK